VIDAEEIATTERASSLGHLELAHSPGLRGRDQRANARPGVEQGTNPALVQSADDADVREPLQAAAAQYQCNAFDAKLQNPVSL
jgi:hypothetical protein